MLALGLAVVLAGCGARFPETVAAGQAGATGGGVASDGSGGSVDPAAGEVVDPATGAVVDPGSGAATGGASTPGATTAGGSSGGGSSTGGSSGGGGTVAGGAKAPVTVAGGGPGTTTAAVASGATPPTAIDKQGLDGGKIKIGVLVPITGAAPVPTTIKTSVQVACMHFAETLIAGRGIDCIVYDTQSTLQVAKEQAQKAVQSDKVFTLFILDRIDIQEGITAYLNSIKFPNFQVQMTPRSLQPANQIWSFGLTIDQGDQGKLIADYLIKVMKFTKIGVVTEQQSQLAPGRDAFKKEAAALGAQVVYDAKINGQANDFSAEASSAKSSGAQGIWLYVAPTPAINFSTTANTIAYHPTWMASSISWGFNLALSAAPIALKDARAFAEWPTLEDPRANEYKAAYAKYGGGNAPDDLGLVAWGTIEVVVQALKGAAANLGQGALRDAAQKVNFKPVLWAPIDWTGNKRVGTSQVTVFKESGGKWALERDYTSGF